MAPSLQRYTPNPDLLLLLNSPSKELPFVQRITPCSGYQITKNTQNNKPQQMKQFQKQFRKQNHNNNKANLAVSGALFPSPLVISISPRVSAAVVQIVHVELALIKRSFRPSVPVVIKKQKKNKKQNKERKRIINFQSIFNYNSKTTQIQSKTTRTTCLLHSFSVSSVVFPLSFIVVAVVPVKLARSRLLIFRPLATVHVAVLPAISLSVC